MREMAMGSIHIIWTLKLRYFPKTVRIYFIKTIQYDYLIRDKPYYPGTGHAHELHYVWGSTKYDLYRVLMHGLEPEDFEHDLTFLFESQWNRFSHRGEPWINWSPVEENCETLVINKDKVSFTFLLIIFFFISKDHT